MAVKTYLGCASVLVLASLGQAVTVPVFNRVSSSSSSSSLGGVSSSSADSASLVVSSTVSLSSAVSSSSAASLSSTDSATPASSLVSSTASLSSAVSLDSSVSPSSSDSLSSTESVSSTASLSSSVSPSASAAVDLLTCEGKATGSTFTRTTSKGNYDVTCGADYPGGDLKFLWTDSFDACVAACDEESSCLTVAFRSGACYLKSQLTTPVTDASVWSAKKHDAVTAPSTDPTCIDKASDATTYRSSSGKNFKIVCGREYYGGDLTSASTTSFKECIDTCATTAGCVDVSYVNGACYLKSSTSTLMEAGHVWTAELLDLVSTTTSTASTASATPTASAAAATNELTCADSKDNQKSYIAANGGTYVVECGVDYGGNDLQAVDSPTFAACMDTCDSTNGCVDVSYVWGRCYLKSSATSSSPAGHVWTGRRTSAGPSDSDILSALTQDGGSFCTSYIKYKAPVTTKVTTTTPGASTVLSVRTTRSTSTKFSTIYVTRLAVETLPALEPRQAAPTPSIVSGLPATRISSICSLVATGTSTVLSTTTARVAPTTLISTFTTVVPVTILTPVTTVVTSTTRLPNPTAAVNLDFETGDLYAWRTYASQDFSAAVVSPGHTRSGVTSNFAVQMSKKAGITTGYSFYELQQNVPTLVAEQTYRIEFSWKYSADVDSSDVCSTWVSLWGTPVATLIPSTTSSRLNNEHTLYTTPKCGSTPNFSWAKQTPQQPGEWRRYTTYYRAPSYLRNYDVKQIWYGLQCNNGTQAVDQRVFFDDLVIAPEAAC